MTLPANSTFLPVLDDLLSPDFRPVLLPAQTPQTPSEHAFSVSASGPITKVNFGENLTSSSYGDDNSKSDSKITNERKQSVDSYGESQKAAQKIQRWWKLRKGKPILVNGNGSAVDIKVERAKHSIRHTRTEDHIRFLEAEVNRLKGALSAERKLRSLQLEAIRSLWSQVQKFSSSASTDLANSSSSSLMTQSVPNGLPNQLQNLSPVKETGVMSMSLNSSLNPHNTNKPVSPCKSSNKSSNESTCTCTKEIQNLRESLTSDMIQLRAMIDQLRLKNDINGDANHRNGNESDENSRISQQKRPLSLNLIGVSNKEKSEKEGQPSSNSEKPSESNEVTGYADQMAAKLLEDAADIETEPTQ